MIQVYRNIYRGPRPTPELLTDNDIQIVINLQSGFYEIFHEDEYERIEVVTDTQYEGITKTITVKSLLVAKIKCVPVLPPSMRAMKEALDIIWDFPAHRKIYIHCAEGVDRTGWLCALIKLKATSITLKEAKEDMKENGFHMLRFWWWLPFLGRYAKKLT